jgi:hypothetical protein
LTLKSLLGFNFTYSALVQGKNGKKLLNLFFFNCFYVIVSYCLKMRF